MQVSTYLQTRRLPGSERRRQLSAAALKILADHGATRLTARALAKEVGLSDGAIFRHFANKNAIVDSAIDSFEVFLTEDIPPAAGSPLERLRAFFVQRLRKLRLHPEILKLVFSGRLEEAASDAGAKRVRAVLREQAKFVMGCVRAAQSAREINADVEPEILTWMVMGTMRGAATRRDPNDRLSPELVFRNLEMALGASTDNGSHNSPGQRS